MGDRVPGPETGGYVNQGTLRRGNDTPPTPSGMAEAPSVTAPLGEQVDAVAQAIYGVVVDLVPDSHNAESWTSSVLSQTLLQGNVLEDILKDFANNVASGSIQLGGTGKVSVSSPASQWDSALLASGSTVLQDRLNQTKQVQNLYHAFDSFSKSLGSQVKTIWESGNKDQICILVAVAAVAGGAVVAGLVDIDRTKNDKMAGYVADIAKIPKFKVGQLEISGGKTTWKPSTGEWSTSLDAQQEWQLRNDVTLHGMVEVSASNKGVGEKGTADITYKLGSVGLDSITLRGSGAPTGQYDLYLGVEKAIGIGDGRNKFTVSVGATYNGSSKGESGNSGRWGGQASIKWTFGEGSK